MARPAPQPAPLLVAVMLPLVAACAGGPEPAADTRQPAGNPQPLEAWSFNLRYGTADDGEHAWPRRAEHVQALVGAARPALLGVQEALVFQVEALRAVLPDHAYFGRPRTPSPGAEQCGIFWDTGRFRQRDGGHFWLSPTPAEIGSRGWDAALPRMATWLVLEDLHGGGELLVCNTHFDHRGEEARLQSARLLGERLPALAAGRAVVLLGDFNASGGSAPLQALAGEGAPFVDTWSAVHGDVAGEGTFHGFRGVNDGRRIDWVLVSRDWRVLEAEVLRPRPGGRYVSDHEPVRARLLRR